MRTILILILSLVTYSAMACECKVNYSMQANFRDAALVARVKVVAFNDRVKVGFLPDKRLGNLYAPFTKGFAPRLKIEKIYKGKLRKKTISLSNTQYCGNEYTLGESYVLFIYTGGGKYYTHICENNFLTSDNASMEKLEAILEKN